MSGTVNASVTRFESYGEAANYEPPVNRIIELIS